MPQRKDVRENSQAMSEPRRPRRKRRSSRRGAEALPETGLSRIVVLLNKPYGVLCQFRPVEMTEPRPTLAHYLPVPDIYPAGRLDRDSEGLVVLTNDGGLQHRLTDPGSRQRARAHWKTYWVQVEGLPGPEALAALRGGILLEGRLTRAARVRPIREPPHLWPRDPPIRTRARIPTSWLEMSLREGRNRQIRRMTAAVGHPTLRLVRFRIGPFSLGNLAPGAWAMARDSEPAPPEPTRRPTPRRRTD